MPNREFDITKITDYLYISAWPVDRDAKEIEDFGIRLIL